MGEGRRMERGVLCIDVMLDLRETLVQLFLAQEVRTRIEARPARKGTSVKSRLSWVASWIKALGRFHQNTLLDLTGLHSHPDVNNPKRVLLF